MTGVGSTEPAKSGGGGLLAPGAGSGVGSTEPAKSGGGGLPAPGAGSGVGSTMLDAARHAVEAAA
jgi:hypothetical protein